MNKAKRIVAAIFGYLIVAVVVTVATVFYDYFNGLTFLFPFTLESAALFLFLDGFCMVLIFGVIVPELTAEEEDNE